MRVPFRTCLLLLTATPAAAMPCLAQDAMAPLEFGSFAGLYLPTVRGIRFGCWGVTPSVVQRAAPIIGTRVTSWGSPRLGTELSVAYAPAVGVDPAVPWVHGHVTMVSTRLLWRLTPPPSAASLFVAGGLAVLAHGGDAYTNGQSDLTNWAPVVGVVGHLRLGAVFALRGELDDYFFTFTPAVTQQGPPPHEHDLVVSLGLSVTAFGHTEAAR